ncbi:MAG: GNAT family N-acetyltransferase [Erysipelotrichaceae bacterium]
MIELAKKEDTLEIYQLWKAIFKEDDGGYSDYFFANKFKPENTLIIRKEQKIVATLYRNPHLITFHQQTIPTSMIMWVATMEQYRHLGYMKALVEYALHLGNTQEMVTLIQAYQPSLYTPFDFEMTYYNQRYHIIQSMPCDAYKIQVVSDTSKLKACYNEFMKKYEGYYNRDNKYFEDYLKEVKAQGGHLIEALCQDQCIAYLSYYEYDDYLKVDELIYENQSIAKALIAQIWKSNKQLYIEVPEAQDLSFLGTKTNQLIHNTMIRINDLNAFANLLGIKQDEIKDYLKNSNLYLHECA